MVLLNRPSSHTTHQLSRSDFALIQRAKTALSHSSSISIAQESHIPTTNTSTSTVSHTTNISTSTVIHAVHTTTNTHTAIPVAVVSTESTPVALVALPDTTTKPAGCKYNNLLVLTVYSKYVFQKIVVFDI